MKKYLFLLLLLIPIKVYAENSVELTNNSTFYIADMKYNKFNDGNVKTYNKIVQGNNLVIHNENPIKQLYIVYEITSKTGTLTTGNGDTLKIGQDGYLHEYINSLFQHCITNA